MQAATREASWVYQTIQCHGAAAIQSPRQHAGTENGLVMSRGVRTRMVANIALHAVL